MTLSVGLLLFAVLTCVFGCGFFCCFLVLGKQQVIRLTLPGETLVVSGPLNDLQGQLRRMEQRLRQFGARVSHDGMVFRAAATPDAQVHSIRSIMETNAEFETQVQSWIKDLHNTREKCSQSVDHPTPQASSYLEMEPVITEEESRETSLADRRCETRHPFYCKQWVSPYNGCRAPEPEEFFAVQCRDISSGGISFFLDRKPAFDLIVFRLQGPERPKYLTARIARVTPSDNRELGRYIIGCQFLGTLHADVLAPHLDSAIERREQQLLEAV